MSERPCDVCRRPKWNGGHAQNERECTYPNSFECRLIRELDDARSKSDEHEVNYLAAVEMIRRIGAERDVLKKWKDSFKSMMRPVWEGLEWGRIAMIVSGNERHLEDVAQAQEAIVRTGLLDNQ